MKIKKEKLTDGLFTDEVPVYPLINATEEAIEEIKSQFDKSFSAIGQLEGIENRINKILTEADITSSCGKSKAKQLLDKNEIGQVKHYAEDALFRLKEVRKFIEKKDIDVAVRDTIWMMDALWRAYMHTPKIKSAIYQNSTRSIGSSAGGNNRSEMYEPCRKLARSKAKQLKESGTTMKRSKVIDEIQKIIEAQLHMSFSKKCIGEEITYWYPKRERV